MTTQTAIQNRIDLLNGRIVLLQGDCLDILSRIKRNTIDLAINDPPYYKVVKADWDHQWLTLNDYLDWARKWIDLEIPLLKQHGSLYMFGGVGEKSDSIVHLYLLLKSLNLHFKDWITWSKSRGMGNRHGWVYAREELLWFVKSNDHFIWNKDHQYSEETRKRDKGSIEIRVSNGDYKCLSPYKRITSVWSDISEQGKDVLMKPTTHFTPKPIKAIERIIAVHTTNPSNVVLDPFMGTGTTGEACVKLNRRFIGIEKDKQSFDEAVYFIQKAIDEHAAIYNPPNHP